MIIKLAVRNLIRRFTRSLLITLTLVVGVVSILFLVALSEGIMDSFIHKAVSLELGDVVIQAPGFQKNRSIDQNFLMKAAWLKELKTLENIKRVHLRVKAQGMAAIADRSAGVLITGLDPQNEKDSHLVFKKIISGQIFSTKDLQGVLIGKALAEKLKLQVGDRVVLMAQDTQSAIGSGAFRVSGIFNTGSPDFDKSTVLISLAASQRLLALGANISQAVVEFNDYRHGAETVLQIKAKIKAMEILTWQEQMPILATYRTMMDWSARVSFVLMFLCVGICVINVFVIAVFERTREFGVLMAIGNSPRQIILTLLTEGIILGALSYAAGVVIAMLLVHHFQMHPLDFSAFSKGMETAGFDTILKPVLIATHYYYALFAVLVTVFLGALLPALPVLKLKPVEAINRH